MTASIAPDTISQIAKDVFGETSRVASIREIVTTEEHGITKVAESTRNLLYTVRLKDVPQPFVFRFSRTEEDVFEREVQNYRCLAEQAGVRVPEVYRVDRSQRLAPTSYMVMEYLPGDAWPYLVHPENPETTPQEKAEIRRKIGHYYGQVHGATKEATPSRSEAQAIGYALDRLEYAARSGIVEVEPESIDRCRQAVRQEPRFKEDKLSLCLVDSEIHVAKENGSWELSFVCDTEWVGYRHRYFDLVRILAGDTAWWRLDRPLQKKEDPARLAQRPFFQGYETLRSVDYEALLELSPYYQLGLWAYLAAEGGTPEKRHWIKQCKEPLIQELVRLIAARA